MVNEFEGDPGAAAAAPGPAKAHGPVLRYAVLIGFFAVTFLIAGLGSMATGTSSETWYATLEKPALNPPSVVFPIVWNILYAMMAFAAWRVWDAAGSFANARIALGLYGLQLLLNLSWTVLFFALRLPLFGLIEIFFLAAAVLATTVAFFIHDRLAGFLMLPYLAWVCFAAYLNLGIVQLNG